MKFAKNTTLANGVLNFILLHKMAKQNSRRYIIISHRMKMSKILD